MEPLGVIGNFVNLLQHLHIWEDGLDTYNRLEQEMSSIKAVVGRLEMESALDDEAKDSLNKLEEAWRTFSKSSTETEIEELLRHIEELNGRLLMKARVARRFELLGAANLLYLQKEICSLQKEICFLRKGRAHTPQPSSTANEPGAGPTDQLPTYEAKLRDQLRKYYDLLLKRRQVLSLPGVPENDFISLDPCNSPTVCPPIIYPTVCHPKVYRPNGVPRLLHFLIYKKNGGLGDYLCRVLLLGFLLMLPAATIFALYAIPTTLARLLTIGGESAVLVSGFLLCGWSESKKGGTGEDDALLQFLMEKQDLLGYIVGLAAVQVVFVGSVVGAK